MAVRTPNPEVSAEAASDLQVLLGKRRSRFDALCAQTQAAIVALVDRYDCRTVASLLAEPPPKGLAFKISKSGLNDFHRRYKKAEAERRAAEQENAAAQLLDKSADPDKSFQTAFERRMRIRLLATTEDPAAPLETIDALVTSLNKLRKQALAERKQLHAEKIKPSPPQKHSIT